MEVALERKPKRPHYIPRPPGKPFKYQCFQCPFTCNEKSHLFNHMKYNLCKNSISLLSQKGGQAPRQPKPLIKDTPPAPAPPKDSPPAQPKAGPGGPEQQESKADELGSGDDNEEVDVGCNSPIRKDGPEIPTEEKEIGENKEANAPTRPSAFSAVTPKRENPEALASPVQRQPSEEQAVPPHSNRAFPWGPISAPIPFKSFPSPIVPQYPSYLLSEHPLLYSSYYLPESHGAGPPSFHADFLEQRPLVPQAVPQTPPSLFPQYPFCPSLHLGHSLHYNLYRSPELSVPLPRSRFLDLYNPAFVPKGYELYMHQRDPQGKPAEEDAGSQERGEDKAPRLSPATGCSASGSPDRPIPSHDLQRDAEAPHYTVLGEQQPDADRPRQTVKPVQTLRVDASKEHTEQGLLQSRPLHADQRSNESTRYSSQSLSGEYHGSPSERDYEKAGREHSMAPLNLSTRAQEKDSVPCDERPGRALEEDLPLNLSLRRSLCGHDRPAAPRLSPDTNSDEEEPGDRQRQTAALALCQLAGVGASCGIAAMINGSSRGGTAAAMINSSAGSSSTDAPPKGSPCATAAAGKPKAVCKQATKDRGLKRKHCAPAGQKSTPGHHKSAKKAARRRPRCS
ncbi:zinc finger protein 750 [Gadus macrocephalus]|uniref:zinc finger protein 750 n=1 Tax=Gadus macrocephalus TaxID=80720 RepID=UPI0028CBADD9|nr:zinc finger protein 750 [Gadus macrocephalus]